MFPIAFLYRNIHIRSSKNHWRVFVYISGAFLFIWTFSAYLRSNTDSSKSRLQSSDPQESLDSPQTSQQTSWAGFAEFKDYKDTLKKAEGLPLHVVIEFKDAVNSVKLEGWEDEWFSNAEFNSTRWGKLKEPKIDFVYHWVNGSEPSFMETMSEYEAHSKTNDAEGTWVAVHTTNRYRVWDEFKYSIRSVEKYGPKSRNKIQILVHDIKYVNENGSVTIGKQRPAWLKPGHDSDIEIISHQEFFTNEAQSCLPVFSARTIETQLFNTASDTDMMLALNDDMFLGKQHAASDIYSPLFGMSMGFKSNSYNKKTKPNNTDLQRFGEKPGLIYTSWLLNQRFGARKRKGQVHIGRPISRRLTAEAVASFPSSSLLGSCRRFRNEDQQHSIWFLSFHYAMERHRETLLWSYLLRMDRNKNGVLDPAEFQALEADIESGKHRQRSERQKTFMEINKLHSKAGLEPPRAHSGTIWTSLDGPYMIQNLTCQDFDLHECVGTNLSSTSDQAATPISISQLFKILSSKKTRCGDCLLKILLDQVPRGLSPLLPHAKSHRNEREMIIKALKKYQYSIIEPSFIFVMMNGTKQIQETLIEPLLGKAGQRNLFGEMCINDDVKTNDVSELEKIQSSITQLYEGLYPDKSRYEI